MACNMTTSGTQFVASCGDKDAKEKPLVDEVKAKNMQAKLVSRTR